MTPLLVIFFSGYVSVFLLGFQSRLVNTGSFLGAAGCSFTISMFQTQLWAHLMSSHSLASSVVYGLAGACGITSAMYAHKRYFKIKE